MYNDTPSIWVALAPPIVTTFIFFVIGLAYSIDVDPGAKAKTVAWISFGGFLFGVFWANQLIRRIFPDRFYEYANDVDDAETESDEPPIFLIEDKVKGITYRLSRCGICINDWQRIAETAQTGAYTQALFENIFGREEEIGRTMYRRISPILENVGILKSSGNGYKVTEFGGEKFEQIAKGDWRIPMREIPEAL